MSMEGVTALAFNDVHVLDPHYIVRPILHATSVPATDNDLTVRRNIRLLSPVQRRALGVRVRIPASHSRSNEQLRNHKW